MNDWSPDLIALAHSALEVETLPDAEGNARPASEDGPIVEWNSVVDMATFDQLPPMARYALNYADQSYSASQVVLFAVAKNMPPTECAARLVTTIAKPSKEKPDPYHWRDLPLLAARTSTRVAA
jgi:hypothetical protein